MTGEAMSPYPYSEIACAYVFVPAGQRTGRNMSPQAHSGCYSLLKTKRIGQKNKSKEMKYINFTTIVLALFSAYIVHSVYIISTLFQPPKCKGGKEKCILAYYDDKAFLNTKFSVCSMLSYL